MPDRFNPRDHRNATCPTNTYDDGRLVHLEVVRGRTRYRIRPVSAPAFLIGAAADCDLVVGDSRFPEVHACLFSRGGELSIRHLGFAPGLLVNGRPVGHSELRHGDVIGAGPFEFRLFVGPPDGGGDLVRPPFQSWSAPTPERDDADASPHERSYEIEASLLPPAFRRSLGRESAREIETSTRLYFSRTWRARGA